MGRVFLVLLAVSLTACSPKIASQADEPPTENQPANTESLRDKSAANGSQAAEAVDPDSAEAAVAVVRRYHALIAAHQYQKAWALWGHEGTDSGMTVEAFAASFDKYTEYFAEVGTAGRIDAGMMQRWVTVPVKVTGTLKSGGAFAFDGPFILHRIAMDDPEVTVKQREWRIRQSGLKPTPVIR